MRFTGLNLENYEFAGYPVVSDSRGHGLTLKMLCLHVSKVHDDYGECEARESSKTV